jgi:two-component system, OmpR family, sensor histidine kinase BaeS
VSPRVQIEPLRRVGSIKAKISILIVLAVSVSALMSQIGVRLGWPIWIRPVVAAAVSLALVRPLARGLTAPLRAMAEAATEVAHGNYDRAIVTGSVDEVGQLAVAFTTMSRALGTAEVHRRDLLANVSHELRTPIAGVRAQLENLADGVEEPSNALFAGMLQRMERLSRLVDDLLELARLEAGVVPLHRRTVPVANALDDAAAELAARDATVRIVQRVEPGLVVDADPMRLQQIVLNLLDNAASHAAGTEIEIDARAVTAMPGDTTTGSGAGPAAWVEIRIRDHGPGIPPDRMVQVFERFARLETTPSDGTGLGLAIVRWLVELHGGTVRFDETCNDGTRVIVVLPQPKER